MFELSKKQEKFVSALYLVTSFFDDKEPIKWKIRTLASELVSLSVVIRDSLSKEHDAIILKTRNLILEISSLLQVTKNVGLVSDANHLILDNEFKRHLELLGYPSGMSENAGSMALSKIFSSSDIKMIQGADKLDATPIVKDKKEVNLTGNNFTVNYPVQHVQSYKTQDKTRDLKNFGVVLVKKNSRQSIIISILKRKKEVMIKDVSPLISGCSEKTIQRELSQMVQDGVIKKTGEKRWSRYSLA